MRCWLFIVFFLVGTLAFSGGDFLTSHFYVFPELKDDISPKNGDLPISKLPTGFVPAGNLVGEGEWGDINVDEIQGITHSDKYWYISAQWRLYKVSRKNFPKIENQTHLMKVQMKLKNGWYRHFGGIVYHEGLIYVATTGRENAFTTERATPIVVVFDDNLNFVKYAKFPVSVQRGVAWVGVNPVNEKLFSSGPYNKLHEYELEFKNGDTLRHIRDYEMVYKNAKLTSAEWGDVPMQGGGFSESGIFYFVLDMKHCSNNPYTGIHAFTLQNGKAVEFDLPGLNNKGKIKPFISIEYVGSHGDDRFWEMEDVTIEKAKDGPEKGIEYLYHLQLRNGKKDEARIVKYRLDY